MGTIGIDTLCIFMNTNDYIFKSDTGLEELNIRMGNQTLSRSWVFNDYILGVDENGKKIHGSRAFKNFEDGMKIDVGRHGLITMFSIPRIYTGEGNVNLVNKDKTYSVLKKVNKRLKEFFIFPNDKDIFNSKIVRMDTAFNCNTKHRVSMYINCLRQFPNNRMDQTQYPSGILLKNRQREICVYDKGLQSNIVGKNILRIEIRNHKGKTFRKDYGIATPSELLDSFYKVKEEYKKRVIDWIGQPEVQDYSNDLDKVNIMKHIRENRGGGLNKFYAIICEKFFSASELRDICIAAGYKERQIWNILRENEKNRLLRLQLKEDKKDDWNLLKEIMEKIKAA